MVWKNILFLDNKYICVLGNGYCIYSIKYFGYLLNFWILRGIVYNY